MADIVCVIVVLCVVVRFCPGLIGPMLFLFSATEADDDDDDSDSETPQITIVYKTKREQIDAFKVGMTRGGRDIAQCQWTQMFCEYLCVLNSEFNESSLIL